MIDILSEIPDFREAKGKRHPLSAILALVCVATMCGCKGYRAFAEWGRNYGKELTKALGFTHEKSPCAATFSNIFRRINVNLLEKKLSHWAESVLGAINDSPEDGVSLDGKTATGSKKLLLLLAVSSLLSQDWHCNW